MRPVQVKSEGLLADTIETWEKEMHDIEKHDGSDLPDGWKLEGLKMILTPEVKRYVDLADHRYGTYRELRSEVVRYAWARRSTGAGGGKDPGAMDVSPVETEGRGGEQRVVLRWGLRNVVLLHCKHRQR